MPLMPASTTTNNADWQVRFVFTDDSDQPIDFTGAYVEVEVRDQNNCKRIEASTSNGKLVIADLGTVDMSVPASEMATICQGSYNIGGLYKLGGATVSLFVGTVQILDGVARA
jgi:hypothetical protein